MAAAPDDPIFTLEGPLWRQRAANDQVLLLAAASRTIAIVTARGRLVRLNNGAGASEAEEHELGLAHGDAPLALSLEPSGQLLLVSTRAGECFAHAPASSRSGKPRPPVRLTKTRGSIIECAAWTPLAAAGSGGGGGGGSSLLLGDAAPAREVLVGTSSGTICELGLSDSGKERSWRVLLALQLSPAQPVCALAVELLQPAAPGEQAAALGSPGAAGASPASPAERGAGGVAGLVLVLVGTRSQLLAFSGTSAEAALSAPHRAGTSPDRAAAAAAASGAERGRLLVEVTLPPSALPASGADGARGLASRLEVFAPAGGRGQALLWASHAGLFHAKLAPPPHAAAPLAAGAGGGSAGARWEVVADARLIPTELVAARAGRAAGGEAAAPPPPPRPVAVGRTEFHLLVLQPHELRALSALSGEAACTERFEPQRAAAAGGASAGDGGGPGSRADSFCAMAYDRARGAHFVATGGALFVLRAHAESRSVWLHHLSRAEFDLALAFCASAQQRDAVTAARADAALSSGELHRAAVLYARLGSGCRPFEQLALSLMHATPPQRRAKAGAGAEGGDAGGGLEADGWEAAGEEGAREQSDAPLPEWAHADSSERALITFLSHKLDVVPESSKAQLTLLCTWLVELLLAHLDRASAHLLAARAQAALGVAGGDGAQGAEAEPRAVAAAAALHASAAAELSAFLAEHARSLEAGTTHDLLGAHGALPHLLQHAAQAGDHEALVAHALHAGDAPAALRTLARLRAPSDAPLHYRHAPALLRSAPEATVALWMAADGPPLEPERLLPAMSHWLPQLPQLAAQRESAPRGGPDAREPARAGGDASAPRVRAACAAYLEHAVGGLRCGSGPVHAALLLLLAHGRAEDKVLALLTGRMGVGGGACAGNPLGWAPVGRGNPHLDLRYALGVCEAAGLRGACGAALLQLGLCADALRAALALGELSQAKAVARAAPDAPARSRLWAAIAEHVLAGPAGGPGGGAVGAALSLIDESGGELSLDALLPLLPDSAEMRLLKEPICCSLDAYAAAIDQLRASTDEAARAADLAREDLKRHAALRGALRPRQRCALSGAPLNAAAVGSADVLLFACGHGFLRSAARARLAELRAGAAVPPAGEEEAECALCGDAMIESVRLPLVDMRLEADRREAELWRVE